MKFAPTNYQWGDVVHEVMLAYLLVWLSKGTTNDGIAISGMDRWGRGFSWDNSRGSLKSGATRLTFSLIFA